MKKLFECSHVRISLLAILCFAPALNPAQAGYIYTNLHEFSDESSDGRFPEGSLTLDGNTLYGMTYNGGAAGVGNVFKITTNGTGYTSLHEFTWGGSGGRFPSDSLTLSSNTLYGMTTHGGSNDVGVVFRINTDGSGYTNLHEFVGGSHDGAGPNGSLILDDATFYGMTSGGGSHDLGVVFKMNTDGSNYTNLYAFAGGVNDGAGPASTLTLSDGTLYGMTPGGGESLGVVFKMNTNGTGYTILRKFDGGSGDGGVPYGSLTLSSNTLYGMTYRGGASYVGNVFKINADGSGFTVLHEFVDGTDDGVNPYGSLTLDNSVLYGMTTGGGTNRGGVLFSINTDGSSYTNLYEFDSSRGDGLGPYGSLTLSDGVFYGMTLSGGTGEGVVFKMAPAPPPKMLIVTKVQAKMNFAKPTDNDTCNLEAVLDLDVSYDLTNKVIALAAGGTTNVTFTLDAKGKGRGIGDHGSCKLRYQKTSGLYTLSAKLAKGSWQTAWATYGMINSNIPKPGILITNFPVAVTLGTNDYAGLPPNLHYTAKTGKSGAAK